MCWPTECLTKREMLILWTHQREAGTEGGPSHPPPSSLSMAFAAARIIKDKKDQQEMKWSKSPDGVNITRTGRKVDRQVRNDFRENFLHNLLYFFFKF